MAKPFALAWRDKVKAIKDKRDAARQLYEVKTDELDKIKDLGSTLVIEYECNGSSQSQELDLDIDKDGNLVINIGCQRISLDETKGIIEFLLPQIYTKKQIEDLINKKDFFTDPFQD